MGKITPKMLEDYLMPHEEGRNLYVLKEDLILRDARGVAMGELRKGFVVSDPSMFDLGDVDIGDNNRIVIMIDLPKGDALDRIGLLQQRGPSVYLGSGVKKIKHLKP